MPLVSLTNHGFLWFDSQSKQQQLQTALIRQVTVFTINWQMNHSNSWIQLKERATQCLISLIRLFLRSQPKSNRSCGRTSNTATLINEATSTWQLNAVLKTTSTLSWQSVCVRQSTTSRSLISPNTQMLSTAAESLSTLNSRAAETPIIFTCRDNSLFLVKNFLKKN